MIEKIYKKLILNKKVKFYPTRLKCHNKRGRTMQGIILQLLLPYEPLIGRQCKITGNMCTKAE